MNGRRMFLLLILLLAGTFVNRTQPVSAGDEWQPISQEELKMTSEPKAPGAPAIILYRQVDRDDSVARAPRESNYVRVKIFTEEGRRYANVKIPFFKDFESISNIKARTVRLDGTIVNFDGKIYENEIVKVAGIKFLAKTFTMSDVQPGSIIEYRYQKDLRWILYNPVWTLSEELFTRYAKFSLRPDSVMALKSSWPVGLPAGTAPPIDADGSIRLETHDVPAFQVEDFMPPENQLKTRVEFVYSYRRDEKEPDKFWKKEGKTQFDAVEEFTGKQKAMEHTVAQIVSPGDAPEVKLQKLYARVQQIRNLSFEAGKTEQEVKREKLKDVNNVEDVLKKGYANGGEITWLYLALVRAAGFEAYPVLVSRRDRHFFNRALMNRWELDDNVVLVKLNGKDIYLDPGTAFTPFGYLPWSETGVHGLKLDKDGGTWVQTSMPESAASRVERKANLKLNDTGSLEGKLTVTFSGLDALWRRLEEKHEDALHRKNFLEDEIKSYVPVGIDVELTNKPDWESSSKTFEAEYDLKVPGWASGSGRRLFLPAGLFGGPERHVFEHSDRVHPIYFHYPSEKVDDVTIELPPGWHVNNIPPLQNLDAKAARYNLKVENTKDTLHLTRRMTMDLVLVDQKLYPTLRSFFQGIRNGDDQQIVLQPGTSAARN